MDFASSTEAIIVDNSKRKLTRKLLLALVFLLFIVLIITCIVLAVLYSQEVSKRSADVISGSPNATKYETCDDEQCFYLGLGMVKNINKSVNPCEDFHAYACGGWKRSHPLEDNTTLRTTVGTVVSNKNINVLKNALEQAHLNYSKNGAVMKMVRVYDSCLNTTAIDVLGLQPLNDFIKQYGGWSISQNYDPTVSVAQRIGKSARELNIDSLFGMDVRPNLFNSDVNVLMLKESVLGLNKRDYLDLDEDSEKLRELVNATLVKKGFMAGT